MKYLPVILLLLLMSCSSDPEQSSVSGSDSEKISFPQFPNFPTLPQPPTTKPTTEGSTTTPTTTPSASKTEQCKYAGRFNGDRMTAYCSKKMSQYPAKITIDVPGCVNKTIPNNGTRYQDSYLIVKQSEVSGRGMAIVVNSSCKSTTAYVKY